jgi:AraC-like DNA-binding protein
MSSATLLRKFKRLLNTTPNSYIRTKRLIMAAKILRDGESRISEVCYTCGFNTTTYFTKCFHDYYGCSPQTYQQNHSNI